MESVFVFLLVVFGSWTIGYLIRLIGGPLELYLIDYILCIVSAIGLCMVFVRRNPDRIVLKCLAKTKPGATPSQEETDTLYSSIFASIDYYDLAEDDEEMTIAFTQQLVDAFLFELERRDGVNKETAMKESKTEKKKKKKKEGKGVGQYVKVVIARWIHGFLLIAVGFSSINQSINQWIIL